MLEPRRWRGRYCMNQTDIAFHYLLESAPVIFLILDREGAIIESNRFGRRVLGSLTDSSSFEDMILDFQGQFDLDSLLKNPGREYIFSLRTPDGPPTSYRFLFRAVDDRILVFGHKDLDEMELMSTRINELNRALSNTSRELQKKNARLQDALDHVKTLQGIIPICSHCHKIRNDREIWERIEDYLTEHTEVRLSHSICPDCMKTHYGEYFPEDGNDPD